MFSISWLLDAAERAAKAFAGALLSVVSLGGVNVLHLDWGQALGLSTTATLISILMSIVSARLGNSGTASLVPQIVAKPTP